MPVYVSVLLCVLHTNQCHVWVPSDTPKAGLAACKIEGMESTATYISDHPQSYVKKVRCSIGSKPLPQDEV
jgi:hypothetical protein